MEDSKMLIDDILEVVIDRIIRKMHQDGFLNLTRLRNEKIRLDFRKMRSQEVSVSEAIKFLSGKDYYNKDGSAYRIGEESIRTIVYREFKKRKK